VDKQTPPRHASVNLDMTESLDVTPKTTEQILIRKSGKSEAEVTKY